MDSLPFFEPAADVPPADAATQIIPRDTVRDMVKRREAMVNRNAA